MRILNWNTEAVGPNSKRGKAEAIKAIIAECDPDVVCLTEAHPQTLPAGGQIIASQEGGWYMEKWDRRKVLLWSRWGWQDVDNVGSRQLPKGRFVRATTRSGLTIIGMCIPYRGYHTAKKWGKHKKAGWQGACEYLDALREDILPAAAPPAILIGDFNLQIPPSKYPYPGAKVNQKRIATFAGWQIPTAGEWDDPALDKRFIDHIALSAAIEVKSLRFISRYADDLCLSDHNGVCIDIELPFSL